MVTDATAIRVVDLDLPAGGGAEEAIEDVRGLADVAAMTFTWKGA